MWEIFESAASRYEDWYATARGRRVDRAERALLAWLLAWFPEPDRVLEIGCGTGHFESCLAEHAALAIGLDRSSAMLRQARRLRVREPLVLADAHRLPLRERAVDIAALITTLEFLESPTLALQEAVRVAERGIVLVVLNRWSPGGASRRWGRQSGGALLGRARDLSLRELRRDIEGAAQDRLGGLHWRSSLFPRPFDRLVAPMPLGDVVGVAVELLRPAIREDRVERVGAEPQRIEPARGTPSGMPDPGRGRRIGAD